MRVYFVFICFICSVAHASVDVGSEFVKNGKGADELHTQEYLSLIRPFLPANPNILEAGAHSGEDTVLIGHTWPNGRVFAFEPVETFFKNLQSNIAKHKVSNVSVFPIGLFSTSGKHLFYYSQNCGGASSFLPDNGVVDYQDIQMELPCKNLDEWAAENHVDHIDFMWLDMEGAEYYVLSTAPKILKTTRAILTEINFREFRKGSTQYVTLKTLLESEGFVLHMIWGSANWQATGLFVRSELLSD